VTSNKQRTEVHRVIRIDHGANVVTMQIFSLYSAMLDVVLRVVVLLGTLILALDRGARAGVKSKNSSVPVEHNHEIITHLLEIVLACRSGEDIATRSQSYEEGHRWLSALKS
jgi:hypothetical protein